MVSISLRKVSKKFRLFASRTDRLREALHPFRRRYHQEFWALRHISLDVQQGETLGILGRNGSGKSTLLQIICSVMQPTEGMVFVKGRIAALLELGAGFNPEFTGRQNVMLNGAIMGFSRREMLQRMPAIEAFADIGPFFDQPVKTYSSGMFVRVAFAAAIHVDPDVLVVDEALAVGDVKFQQKCLLQLERIRERGASIVFVSHSIETVTSLCNRAVILERGQIIDEGSPKVIAERYLTLLFSQPSEPAAHHAVDNKNPDRGRDWKTDPIFSLDSHTVNLTDRYGYNEHEVRTFTGGASIVDYLLLAEGKVPNGSIAPHTRVAILVKVYFQEQIEQPIVGFELKTEVGVTITGTNTFLARCQIKPVGAQEVRLYKIEFATPLNQGDYFMDLGVAKYDGTPGGQVLDVRRSIIHLIVGEGGARFNGIVDIGVGFEEVRCECEAGSPVSVLSS